MNWEKNISNRFYNSKINDGKYLGILSMVGMGVGCFAMVIAISVMNGFETIVHDKLKGFEGDIRLYGNFISEDFQSIDGIKISMPFMERNAVLEVSNQKRIISLKALEEEKISSFYNLNLRGNFPSDNQIVIGQDLAYRIEKDIGDEIIIYSPIDHPIGFTLPRKKIFTISGIFSTKILDYDDRFAFITLDDGSLLFKRKSIIDGYDIRIDDDYQLEEVCSNIKNNIEDNLIIQTWYEKNRSLVNAMRMERYGTVLVLCLIFLVAAFNLAANLTLISIQKIKQVGILRAMGAENYSIYKLIIRLGIMQSGKGAFIGFLFGVFLVVIQIKFSIIPLPEKVYFIDSLPMVLYAQDIFLIFSLSFLFIVISSYLSAKKLVISDIKEAIQWVK